jgi:glycosyltransferase involved in cell wall biosynthesis
VGSGGLDIHACEEALRATVGEKGLEGHVIFTGNVRNVEEYLRAADIFVFPTENDAFPSSLLEAMTSGLPVVTTPVGAIKEIVRDGQTGLLVRPRDPNALASALERLLDDRVLSARLGRSAHEAVQGRYSAERVTEQYVALFEGLASR